jgi:hypothetical protein
VIRINKEGKMRIIIWDVAGKQGGVVSGGLPPHHS